MSVRTSKSSKRYDRFILVIFSIVCFMVIYPLWYVVIKSIISYKDLVTSTFLLIPKSFSTAAYKEVLSNKGLFDALKISVFTVVIGTAGSVLLTSLAAYALSKKHTPFRKVFVYFTIGTMLFHGGTIPMYIMYSKIGLINNIALYILQGMIIPYYLIIMISFYKAIPASVEEAARIDGCSVIGTFFRIVLPMSKPAIATIAMFYAVDKWNNFLISVFFMTDSSKYNLQAFIYTLMASISADEIVETSVAMIPDQIRAAALVISTVPILIIYPFIQKYFVNGVNVGAEKG